MELSNDYLKDFTGYLKNQDRSALTIKGYRADMVCFARWFQQTNGEALTPQAVTPTDLREYREYLITNEERKPSTVNRHLAAISAYLAWAQSTGTIDHNPAESIRNLPQTVAVPRYLSKEEQYALQQAIERDMKFSRLRYPKRWLAHQRDDCLVLFLLNTGLTLQEALDLKINDLHLSDGKGLLLARQGEGGKQRNIPLNAEACKAMSDWLTDWNPPQAMPFQRQWTRRVSRAALAPRALNNRSICAML